MLFKSVRFVVAKMTGEIMSQAQVKFRLKVLFGVLSRFES